MRNPWIISIYYESRYSFLLQSFSHTFYSIYPQANGGSSSIQSSNKLGELVMQMIIKYRKNDDFLSVKVCTCTVISSVVEGLSAARDNSWKACLPALRQSFTNEPRRPRRYGGEKSWIIKSAVKFKKKSSLLAIPSSLRLVPASIKVSLTLLL